MKMDFQMNDNQTIDYTSETLRISADHPCLPGHFPGQPVVPAVVGLQTVLSTLLTQRPDWQLHGIRQAKFMSPLMPGEAFVIELRGTLPTIEFRCLSGDRMIAKGSLGVKAAADT